MAAACAKIRSAGYSLDDGEYLPEVSCLAAPIRDKAGTVVAAIGISAPAARMPKQRCEMLAGKVVRIAKEIDAVLNSGA